ncbi:glycosyltransferase family 9 protein [Granulosicoccaceae sp. 1_MG-2023]|nr:glycosyltransferase family 9 protein [Granulosicoccaceae sp. 1_MG-2023]
MSRKPWHTRLRKKLRAALYAVLGRIFSAGEAGGKIDPQDIRRILIVRINYRIGNVIFLTPFIKALGRLVPDASVDVIVGAACTKNLLRGLPNVGEVYDAPRELLKNPLKLRREIQQLNARGYDLIIDVSARSSSNAIVTALLKAPRKLGFLDDNRWAPLTHGVSRQGGSCHMALQPLTLLEAFTNHDGQYARFLDIGLSEAEQRDGRERLFGLLAAQGYPEKITPLIGIFRNARGDKIIADEVWQTILREMRDIRSGIDFVDVGVPGQAPLAGRVLTISEKDLRLLGGMLSQLDAFVCADTGPMHLASASGVPTIALFKTTRPAKYGTLGEKDLSLEIAALSERQIAAKIITHLGL